MAVARFPAPAHQTGRAEIPHPAFRQTSARAHAERHRIVRNEWTPNTPNTTSKENWRVPRECRRRVTATKEVANSIVNVAIQTGIRPSHGAIRKVVLPSSQHGVEGLCCKVV